METEDATRSVERVKDRRSSSLSLSREITGNAGAFWAPFALRRPAGTYRRCLIAASRLLDNRQIPRSGSSANTAAGV